MKRTMKKETVVAENDRNQVILSEADYNIIKELIGPDLRHDSAMTLAYEIDRAIVMKEDEIPEGTVALGSTVSVQDVDTDVTKTFTLVKPAQANIKTGKVSVLSPMGAAVIGFRKGETSVWQMPGGLKRFIILDVY